MARNTPIQGTAADIIKLAMVHVWQRLRDEKLQARLLLQVHDELIVEAPEEEIDEVKRILKEEMENVVHYSVPLTTEVGVGRRGWRHTKTGRSLTAAALFRENSK